jgi:hypothetical protein
LGYVADGAQSMVFIVMASAVEAAAAAAAAGR